MMNKFVPLLLISTLLGFLQARAQLTIEFCHEKARVNYPLINQMKLIEQTKNFNVLNVSKGFLPQLSVTARASYQSDVTRIPFTLPNMAIEGLTRDQYQAVAEVNQTLWDGGMIRSQVEFAEASWKLEKQKLEVELYSLKERVNQLFFGILLINEQLVKNELLQNELQTNFERILAFVKNGVANQSDLDAVKVEQLKTLQRRNELLFSQKSFKEVLSAMIGVPITNEVTLLKPELAIPSVSLDSNRPEMGLFEAQSKMFDSQKSSLLAANRPKIATYLQTGFGKPGLNMLKNEFSPFYVGGVRLSMNFGGFYTLKNNISKIEVSRQLVENQKEIFLYNNNLLLMQQQNEIEKIKNTLVNDDEIIRLQTNIKKSAGAKVENGTLSVSELIREINAENLAFQERSLHEIQLLMSVYKLKNTTNN